MATIFDPADASPLEQRIARRDRASWGALVAGVVVALVVQVTLMSLGVAIGGSGIDLANMANNPSLTVMSKSVTIWLGVSALIASFIGGLAAGRLCGNTSISAARWHGFVSWGASTLLVIGLLVSAAGGLVGGAASVFGSTINLARRSTAALGSALPDGDALETQVQRLLNPNDPQVAQNDILTFARAVAQGDEPAAETRDRAIASLARVANITLDEARTRLDQAGEQARQAAVAAKQKAQQAAEATRKAVAAIGLYGFATLVFGGFAGWLGGGFGAPSREEY